MSGKYTELDNRLKKQINGLAEAIMLMNKQIEQLKVDIDKVLSKSVEGSGIGLPSR